MTNDARDHMNAHTFTFCDSQLVISCYLSLLITYTAQRLCAARSIAYRRTTNIAQSSAHTQTHTRESRANPYWV